MVIPYYQDERVAIYQGDALELIPLVPGFQAIVTDPPYSSGGMVRSDRMSSTVSKYVTSGVRESGTSSPATTEISAAISLGSPSG